MGKTRRLGLGALKKAREARSLRDLTGWIGPVISILAMSLSLYGSYIAQQAVLEQTSEEHRPLLEVASFEAADAYNIMLTIKNSGRSTAQGIKFDWNIDFGVLDFNKQLPLGEPSPDALTFKVLTRRFAGPMQERNPDAPSGSTFQVSMGIVPSLEYLKAYKLIDFDPSVKWTGSIAYRGFDGHHYDLPICLQAWHVNGKNKIGITPCY